ncbi:aldehyde dehydrogenase [Halobacteriales archaeon SW_7_65_23]|nr:MAG: aldehyde dehydrogenase [Halobacteriales archaeon SW_7_65_23]
MAGQSVQRQLWEQYDHLVEGNWVEPASGEYVETVDPGTEEPITAVADGTAADVDRAVTAAIEAFATWRDTDPVERGQRVGRVADLIRDHLDELAQIESRDQGKPLSQARHELEGAARYFEYYGGAADKLEGSSIPVGPDGVDYTVREPYGVSAQIIPWNLPGNLFARGVAPALAAGNAVVVKPAPTTPLSAFYLAELCHEAGIPGGAVNVVSGGGAAGAALTEHEGVDTITFTGSVVTGQKVMEAAAKSITPVTLELGGKNPAIVYPDADLERAVEAVAMGIFTNAGQVCSAADRALVHESVYDEFVDRIAAVAEGYDLGHGLDDPEMGPLNSADHLAKVAGYLDTGKAEGATLVTGGEVRDGEGYFVEPTVFADAHNDMRIAQEEIFGPVLTVLPFDNDTDVFDVANDVDYGLTAGVFTTDLARAHRAAKRLEAGNVYVNQWFGDTNRTPFGGYKQSGIGREKGLAALDSYLQTKNVAIDLG